MGIQVSCVMAQCYAQQLGMNPASCHGTLARGPPAAVRWSIADTTEQHGNAGAPSQAFNNITAACSARIDETFDTAEGPAFELRMYSRTRFFIIPSCQWTTCKQSKQHTTSTPSAVIKPLKGIPFLNIHRHAWQLQSALALSQSHHAARKCRAH
jgi:hypothetical protein